MSPTTYIDILENGIIKFEHQFIQYTNTSQ
jgi:hypothetical protein